ncbi:MAG: magnesium chelatase, partial [Gammaproteobacteria bacterium]|nr:magnesium chelatase [Gammaproteobacteria bacterium]
QSPDVSQRSGVSVRATISNYETVLANALRRALRLGEAAVVPRISDLPFLLASLQGKIEFETFEDDQEAQVMNSLISQAVAKAFRRRFDVDMLEHIVYGFGDDTEVEVGEDIPAERYETIFEQVPGLRQAVEPLALQKSAGERAAVLELLLEGLHQNRLLNRDVVDGHVTYRG